MRRFNLLLFLSMIAGAANAQFINNGATVTIQAGATLRVETDFTNTSGTITNNGTLEVQGNFTNATGAGATLTPGVGLVKFIGTTASNLDAGGDPLNNVEMAKTANGLTTLTSAAELSGNLNFTGSGSRLSLAGNNLTLAAASTVGTPGANGYVITGGAGSMIKKVSANGSFTFPVGDDATDYSPLAVTYTGTGYSGTSEIKARVLDVVHPNKPALADSYLTRYWDVDAANISTYTATIVGTYVTGDNVGTQADIKGASYTSPTWAYDGAATNGTSTVTGTTTNLIVDFTGLNKLTDLNLTTFIEGYMSGSTMRPVLLNSGIGSSTTNCDNLTVELHNATAPYAMAHTFTGILKTDGTLLCTFPAAAAGNSYYIVIKHRNALQTWSASPIAFTTTTTYNFSTSATQAFGSNMKQIGSLWTLYSGDIDAVNSDGNIDLIDYPIWEVDNNNFESGYRKPDLNGDGNVDLVDYPIWEANNNDFISISKP